MATHLRDAYRVSERRACQVIRLHRATNRYKAKRDDQTVLRMRIREIAATRVRYGYQRIHVLLRREGWKVNHKCVFYREEGLSLRHKCSKRHKSAAHRQQLPPPMAPNERWCLDFVSDALFNGKRFSSLTVLDTFTRESLAIEVDPKAFVSTTALSSSPRSWTAGPTRTALRWISHGLENPRIMRSSNPSTALPGRVL